MITGVYMGLYRDDYRDPLSLTHHSVNLDSKIKAFIILRSAELAYCSKTEHRKPAAYQTKGRTLKVQPPLWYLVLLVGNFYEPSSSPGLWGCSERMFKVIQNLGWLLQTNGFRA